MRRINIIANAAVVATRSNPQQSYTTRTQENPTAAESLLRL